MFTIQNWRGLPATSIHVASALQRIGGVPIHDVDDRCAIKKLAEYRQLRYELLNGLSLSISGISEVAGFAFPDSEWVIIASQPARAFMKNSFPGRDPSGVQPCMMLNQDNVAVILGSSKPIVQLVADVSGYTAIEWRL